MTKEIILNSIKLVNIRSHKSSEIKFTPDGNIYNTIIIYGDIASGKSSLLKSINFALFGFKNQFDTSSGSLLRKNAREGSVTLSFTINGKPYEIKRTLKRSITKNNGITVKQAKVILKEGDVETSITPSEVVKLLDIKDFEKKDSLWNYSIYLKQEDLKTVLEGLNSKINREARLDLIRKALNIDRYKNSKINAGKIVEKIEKKIATLNIKSEELEKKENDAKRLKEEEALATSAMNRQREQSEKLEGEMKRQNEVCMDLSIKKNTIETELKSFIQKNLDLNKKLEELTAKIKKTTERLGEEKKEADRLIHVTSSMPSKPEINISLDELKKYKADLLKLEENKRINESSLEQAEVEMKNITVKVEKKNREHNEQRKEIEGRMAVLKEEIGKLSLFIESARDIKVDDRHLSAFRNRIIKYRSNISAIETDISSMNIEIEKLARAMALYDGNCVSELIEQKRRTLDDKKADKARMEQIKDQIGTLIDEKLCPVCMRSIDDSYHYLRMRDEIRDKVEVLKREIDGLENEISSLSKERENCMKQKEQLELRKASQNEKLKEKERQLGELNSLIAELKSYNVELTYENCESEIESIIDTIKKRNDFVLRVKEYGEELKDKESRHLKLQNEYKELEKDLEERKNRVLTLKDRLEEVSNQLENYTAELKARGIAAGDVNGTYIQQYIDGAIDKLNRYAIDINRYESNKQRLEQVQKSIKERTENLEELHKEYDEMKRNLEATASEIENRKAIIESMAANEEAEQEKAELINAKYKSSMNELTDIEAKLKTIQSQIGELDRSISEMKGYRDMANLLKVHLSWYTDVFIKLCENIENMIMWKSRQELKERFSEIIQYLLPYTPFNVTIGEEFEPVAEYGEVFVSLDDGPSGGERSSIALAYRFALYEVTRSSYGISGLIILDEPTDGFSDDQISKLKIAMDQYLSAKQRIIVSHNSLLQKIGDMEIYMYKENDETKVEVNASR